MELAEQTFFLRLCRLCPHSRNIILSSPLFLVLAEDGRDGRKKGREGSYRRKH